MKCSIIQQCREGNVQNAFGNSKSGNVSICISRSSSKAKATRTGHTSAPMTRIQEVIALLLKIAESPILFGRLALKSYLCSKSCFFILKNFSQSMTKNLKSRSTSSISAGEDSASTWKRSTSNVEITKRTILNRRTMPNVTRFTTILSAIEEMKKRRTLQRENCDQYRNQFVWSVRGTFVIANLIAAARIMQKTADHVFA